MDVLRVDVVVRVIVVHIGLVVVVVIRSHNFSVVVGSPFCS